MAPVSASIPPGDIQSAKHKLQLNYATIRPASFGPLHLRYPSGFLVTLYSLSAKSRIEVPHTDASVANPWSKTTVNYSSIHW